MDFFVMQLLNICSNSIPNNSSIFPEQIQLKANHACKMSSTCYRSWVTETIIALLAGSRKVSPRPAAVTFEGRKIWATFIFQTLFPRNCCLPQWLHLCGCQTNQIFHTFPGGYIAHCIFIPGK